MKKVAVVTGGTRGIGRGCVCALYDAGCTVYECSRHDFAFPEAIHLDLDVSDEKAFAKVISDIVKKEGRIDILVNNAGMGISGAAEFTENADAHKIVEINLFGVVNGCKAVIPYMREQGGGRIVNTSSLAAPIAIPFQSWYSVTKAAVSSYTASVANEVRPFGITLAAVLPGDTKTGFTKAREKSEVGDDIYEGRIARAVGVMEHDEQTGMSAEAAGAFLAGIALKKKVKPEYCIGFKNTILYLVAKFLPCGLRNRILYLIYAK